MVVHPGHGNYSGTLINALMFHFDNLPNNSSNRPGLVHRIDKDTSGLLVVAKTEIAMAHLSAQFKAKTSEREYVALVWGNVELDEGSNRRKYRTSSQKIDCKILSILAMKQTKESMQ